MGTFMPWGLAVQMCLKSGRAERHGVQIQPQTPSAWAEAQPNPNVVISAWRRWGSPPGQARHTGSYSP